MQNIYGKREAYALSCELRKIIFSEDALSNKYVKGQTSNAGVYWSSVKFNENSPFIQSLTR